MPSAIAGNRRRLAIGIVRLGTTTAACLGAAIARQNHGYFVALRHQCLRQRLDHVRKAAGLRERQPFRCNKKNSHSLFPARFLGRFSRPSLLRRIRIHDGVRRIHFTLLEAIAGVKPEAPGRNDGALFLLHFRRMARQRLGQHFLADAGWREQIARAIGVSPHSTLASTLRGHGAGSTILLDRNWRGAR